MKSWFFLRSLALRVLSGRSPGSRMSDSINSQHPEDAAARGTAGGVSKSTIMFDFTFTVYRAVTFEHFLIRQMSNERGTN